MGQSAKASFSCVCRRYVVSFPFSDTQREVDSAGEEDRIHRSKSKSNVKWIQVEMF